MARNFEITVSALAAKAEVGSSTDRINIDITFESQSDFMHEVQDHIDPKEFLEFLGKKDAKEAMRDAYDLQTLDEVSRDLDEIDTLSGEIQDMLSIDADDVDAVKKSIDGIWKKIERIQEIARELKS